MERVSSRGKVKWAREHLRQELRRAKEKRRGGRWIMASVMGGASALTVGLGLLVSPYAFLGTAVFGGLAWLGAIIALDRPRLDIEEFLPLLERWRHVHGEPVGLVEPGRAPRALTPALEAELGSYSFDRVVVCDHPWLVDVLVANQFHFENNCALLTMGGYPQHVFGVVMRMLRQNPKLAVFAVHDASPEGCRMARVLRTDPAWFHGAGTVVDVGLRPEHAKYFPRLEEPAERAIRGGASKSAEEARWLRSHTLSIGLVRPEQLVKRLFRGIVIAEKEGGADGGSGADGTTGGGDIVVMGTDASTSDGGGDSFG